MVPAGVGVGVGANGITSNLTSRGDTKLRGDSGREEGNYYWMGQDIDESAPASINNDFNEGVLRLLKSVKRLGDENASLIHRLEHLHNVESQNASLVREMTTFRSEYQKRFVKLKDALKVSDIHIPCHSPLCLIPTLLISHATTLNTF